MKRIAPRGSDLSANAWDPQKNFGLAPDAFEQMIVQLQAGDQELFKTIFLAHFEECQSYLRHQKQISAELAYDITMDAMLLFRKKMVEGKIKYGNMRFLFTQMANHLFLKSLRNRPQIMTLSGLEHLKDDDAPPFQKEEMDAFNKAWKKLCEECSGLLKQFYYSKTTLQEIAVESQRTAASIRKKKQRCVEKLRNYFAESYTP